MNDSILPVLSQAGIARAQTRLWTAHYGLGEHICGPGSCGALSIDADGTQWTSSARGLVLDQSLLLEDFFTHRTHQRTDRDGGRIAVRAAQHRPRGVHRDRRAAGHGPPHRVRVSTITPRTCRSSGCAWRSSTRPGTSTRTWSSTATRGSAIMTFPNAAKTGMVSVRRNDAGNAAVGYVIYYAAQLASTTPAGAISLRDRYRGRGLTVTQNTRGVLLHHRAEGGQRRLDVLAGAAAHHLVRLDDRGAAGASRPCRRSRRAATRTPRRRAWPGSHRSRHPPTW